jgi:hypothetical protein
VRVQIVEDGLGDLGKLVVQFVMHAPGKQGKRLD